jgi:hypothetical protein
MVLYGKQQRKVSRENVMKVRLAVVARPGGMGSFAMADITGKVNLMAAAGDEGHRWPR